MATKTVLLASLQFHGARFADHALDVDCVVELVRYRDLVLECAKELWRRANPERDRLPKGFDERLTLQFSELTDGSAVVPLRRVVSSDQEALDFGDEFDLAAELIDQAITAADRDDLLPVELPRQLIPMFREFGRSLSEQETLFVQARHSKEPARYSASARERLARWAETTYEDLVDVAGEVNMANVRGSAFELTIAPDQPPVRGKFSESQESEVLAALQSHNTTRLRVRGLAELSQAERQLRRFVRVDFVEACPRDEPVYVEGVKPIWQTIAELGATAPEGAWDAVPADLSTRLDHFLYSSDETD